MSRRIGARPHPGRVLPLVLACAAGAWAGAGSGAEARPQELARDTLVVLGHDGHGKTTLVSAATRVLGRDGGGDFVPVRELEAAAEDRRGSPAVALVTANVRTAVREHTLVDFPSHADAVRALVSGAVQPAGAILVVSAADGPMQQTREHVLLARQAGIPRMVVFLNKTDRVDDPGRLDRVEREVRELLTEEGFPGGDVPVVRGSALLALQGGDANAEWSGRVAGLMEVVDRYVPRPRPAAARPFLLAVEDAFPLAGRGVAVVGRIERGVVRAGDTVEIVGPRATRRSRVAGIEISRRSVAQARAGESAGLLLEGVAREEVGRGTVLARPGSIAPHRRFRARVYVLSREEGGRRTPFFSGYRPRLSLRTAGVDGVVRLPEGAEMAMPGDDLEVTVELAAPVALERSQRFAVHEGGRLVGVGVVTALLE